MATRTRRIGASELESLLADYEQTEKVTEILAGLAYNRPPDALGWAWREAETLRVNQVRIETAPTTEQPEGMAATWLFDPLTKRLERLTTTEG